MLEKYSTLKRRPNEKLSAFWNRYKGFFAENRLMANDSIKADGQVLAQDDPKSRYATSSDIVMCLYMAHEDLPKEIQKIFSAKLEHQDVVSLEADIFTRAQLVLEQLEGNTSVRRSQPQRPQRQGSSFRPRSEGAQSSQTLQLLNIYNQNFCTEPFIY